MSKLLRDVLQAKEPHFTQGLKELEHISNKTAVDVRLTAEIIEKTHSVIKNLGLDSSDTTEKELYHALLHRAADHNKLLVHSLGVTEEQIDKQLFPKLVTAVKELQVNKKCWVIKKSVAKQLLRELPPKSTMKHLGYRSIESMFKKENFSELYTALRFSESREWLIAFDELFSRNIQPSDFEVREIEVIVMNHQKWETVAKPFANEKKHNIVHSKELGVICIAPTAQTDIAKAALLTLALVLHYTNEIRLYSSFFKFKSPSSEFGNIISKTLLTDTETGASAANFTVHWRAIHRHFGANYKTPIDIFQPHVQPEDLHGHKIEEGLTKLNNEFSFWQNIDYVATVASDKKPVSFNLLDVLLNSVHNIPFANRKYKFVRESLWNEIFVRYMGKAGFEKQILQQLENETINKEEIV